MADVRCLDGALLSVHPVPVLDREGVPYEVTLRLLLDSRPFGEVGERCGYFLREAAGELRRAAAGPACSALEAGVRRWARGAGRDADAAWQDLAPYLPRDRELFGFVARDPDDLASDGELRVRLRATRRWVAAPADSSGRWVQASTMVLEAWGGQGTGVRALLDEQGLLDFLDALLAEVDALAVDP